MHVESRLIFFTQIFLPYKQIDIFWGARSLATSNKNGIHVLLLIVFHVANLIVDAEFKKEAKLYWST